MNQAERLRKLKDIDSDIERLEIRVKEAQGRLDAAQAERTKLLKACTHRNAKGKSAWEEGLFGGQCTICLERDF